MTGERPGGAVAAVALVVVACLAPWPFASVEPFWWSVFCGAALAISALAFVLRPSASSGAQLPRAAWVAAILPPLVAAVSIVPLPASLVGLVSPSTIELMARAGMEPGLGWRPLSLFAPAGMDALIVVSACAATAWLVARAALDESARSAAARAFVAGGVLLALFGLAQRLVDPDPQRMFWSVEIYEAGTPFGPYVNRNHFGGAMLLFVGVAAGRAFAARARGRRAELFLMSAAALVMSLALAGTASRGALLGLVVTVVVLLVAMPGRGRWRFVAVVATCAVLLVAGLVATGLFDELAGRLFHVYGRWQNRFLVQADALRIARDHPFVGTGAGTFPWVYHVFQQVDDARHFNDAHSDWAQILMETGLLGVIATIGVVATVTGAGRRALAARRPERWHALGALAGCAGIAAHGFVETNLHIPANALLASVALGLGYGAAVGVCAARDEPPGDAEGDQA